MNLAFAMGLPLVVALSVGCSFSPESELIGKWKADSSAVGTAFRAAKLKTTAPDASSKDIQNAARAMGQTALLLKKDKTFDLRIAIVVYHGTWSFDKGLGEVQLDIASADVEELSAEDKAKQAAEFKPHTWVAYRDTNDYGKLELYTADRKGVETIKAMGVKAAKIVLRK